MFKAIELKITICFVLCLVVSVFPINGQNESKELPKIFDGNIQGEARKMLLKGFCRAADCERFNVRKVERFSYLDGVDIYSITTANHFSEFVLRHKNKSYITLKKKDLERFLKAYKILLKPEMLNEFVEVYKYFRLDDGAINQFYVVDDAYLAENSKELKKYETSFEKIAYRQFIHHK